MYQDLELNASLDHASPKDSSGRNEEDAIDFENFKKHVKFIIAECGVEVEIMSSPDVRLLFKDRMEQNLRRLGMAAIISGDISEVFLEYFQVTE